jgi:uncharacterized membrane protein YkvA (DUF1232 family)
VPPMSSVRSNERKETAVEIQRERIGEILRPGTEEQQERRKHRVQRSFFATLKRAARHVPFMEDVVASYYCAMDSQTTPATRGILLAALAYFVLPIDVVPDFIAGLGFTDDAAVLLAAFSAVQRDIRPRHYAKARATLGDSAGQGREEASHMEHP